MHVPYDQFSSDSDVHIRTRTLLGCYRSSSLKQPSCSDISQLLRGGVHAQWAQQTWVPSTTPLCANQMHPSQLDLHLPQLMQQQVRPFCEVHAASDFVKKGLCHCSCSQTAEIPRSPRVMQLLVASLNGALWTGSSTYHLPHLFSAASEEVP